MSHTQEPLAWGISISLYAYFCFSVWFLKHCSTTVPEGQQAEEAAKGWHPGYIVDKALKVGLAAMWLTMTFLNTQYRVETLTAVSVLTTKVSYFVTLQWFSTFAVVGLGIVKNAPAYFENSEKFLKGVAFVIVETFFLFMMLWQTMIISHVGFNDLYALDIPAAIAVAATVFAYLAYVFALFVMKEDAINFVDTTDDIGGTSEDQMAKNRPVVGTTPGYLVEVHINWMYIVAFNLLSMYTWTQVFNDYGRVAVATFIQQFITMYVVHWSGGWNAWPEVYIFMTMILSSMYCFVPGTFFRYGGNSTGIPSSEYQHLMFFMDDSNTVMALPAVMYTNKLAISSLAIIISIVVFGFSSLELFQHLFGTEDNSKAANKARAEMLDQRAARGSSDTASTSGGLGSGLRKLRL